MPSPVHSYFVTIDGKQHGPYRAQQIRAKLGQGKLSEADFIWREGMPEWVPIAAIIAEFPGVTPPPLPDEAITRITKLTITHPTDFPTTEVPIPPKGMYEPAATLKQKNLLMKLGCKNHDLLRILGHEQASFMIDAFAKDTDELFKFESDQRAHERSGEIKATLRTVAPILTSIALAALLYGLLKWLGIV